MPGHVLSFGAHPDDIEIGCGGTEAGLIKRGYEVTHVFATSGEAGSDRIAKSELAAMREDEARAAAGVLGVRDVEFLGMPDGLTHFTPEMKIAVIGLIRRLRPEIVFVHAACDRLLDHRVVYEMVIGAVTAAAGPWCQDAGGEPWQVPTVLGYEVWHPLPVYQLAVDISAEIETKMAALACHRSQIQAIPYDDAFRGLARYRGIMSISGDYAEVFEVIRAGAILQDAIPQHAIEAKAR
jgi:LmbE family N-acetylglucosaminyl deacetylase